MVGGVAREAVVVDLIRSPTGGEHRVATRKLNVQGVVIESPHPEIVVRHAINALTALSTGGAERSQPNRFALKDVPGLEAPRIDVPGLRLRSKHQQ
jgi:hypothetical protein